MKYKIVLILIHMLIYSSLYAQSTKTEISKETDHSVNFGIKAGFNSSMYFVDRFRLVDVTIDEIQNNYKAGYYGALFMRINMNKHFIQPEIHYTISKSEIMFDKNGSQHPEFEPDYATIDATIHTIELPILYGYNFVKRDPYKMSFFVGPKPKYVLKKKSKLEFGNFSQENLEEELYPINVSIIAGVAVSISKIFFDFSYEVGLHNISKSITYDFKNNEGSEQRSNITFNRRNNILSFSLGMIF